MAAIIASIIALSGLFIAWLVYYRRYQQLQELPPAKRPDDPLRQWLGPIFTGMENKWWVDELYNFLFIRPYVVFAGFLAEVVDWRFWHDWFHDTVLARSFRAGTRWLNEAFDLRVIDGAANGLGKLTKNASARLRHLQTGYVRNYALSVLVGVVLVLSYFLFG